MVDTLRVLYVDDEPGLLNIAKIYLEKGGAFSVDTLTSAKQALKQLNTEQYDAIISDYQMPEMDGIAFLVEVRARFGQVPFILFTGRGREEVVIQAINSGADFYIQKGGEPAAQFAELTHKVRQAASRKRAEEAIKRSEAQLIAIIQGSPIPKFVIDRDHHVIHWNKALEGYSGILEKEIVGTKQHWRAFYKTERPCLADLLLDGDIEKIPGWYAGKYAKSKLIDGAYEATDFFPHMGKAGTWLFFTAVAITDDNGGILGAVETLEDITETRLKTEELKDAYQKIQVAFDQAKLSEERYRNVVEDQTEFISRFYPDGTHVFVNEAYCRYFGKSREEILGTRFHPTIHPDDRKSVARFIASLTPDHPIETIDQRIIMPDGSTRWQRWIDRAIFLSDGRLKEYQSVGRDITEHKRVEEELRESEEQLHNFISNLPVGLYRNTIGPKGNFLMANPHIARMHGYETLEEFLCQPTADMYMNPNERIAISDQLIREGSIFGKEIRLKRKNGEIFWGRVSAVAVRNQKGEVRCFDGFIEDITKGKRAEKDLRESEEQLHLAIDGANLGLWDMDLHSGEMVHNQRWAEMLGFSMDELEKPSEWWGQRVHPDDYQDVLKLSKLHQLGKTPFFDAVYRMKHKNGEWRWVHSQGKVILWDSNGAALRLIGINQDITGQKEAEREILKKNEELRASYEQISATEEELQQNFDEITASQHLLKESEERYRTVFENTGTATVVLEENGIISLANEEFAQLCGFSKSDIEEKKSWAEFVVKEDLERMHAQHRLRRQDEAKALTHYEFRFVTKSGDIRNIYLSIGIIPGTKKSVASLLDITGRKRADELYQIVFENTGTAMIILEEDTTISHVNDEMEKIWGYSKEEIEGRVKWPKLVAAEDLEKMLAYHRLRRNDPDSAPRNYEFRFVHKDGGLRDAALTASMIPGTKKSVISLRDITEFKNAEQALRQANKKLNLLSSITRHDINNQLTVLQGCLEILEDSKLDPSQNEYFQKVTTAAQHISAMIQVTKEYEEIGVHAPKWLECRTLVDTAAKQAPLGMVVVKNDLPAGTEVFADPLIPRVFYNLIDNAVRYGGKITNIRFAVEERNGDHIVVCEDDGDGIVEEEKEKIFARGFGKNTGLGLALSREILDITGITIRETGEPGKGARFEMTVPKGTWRIAGNGD